MDEYTEKSRNDSNSNNSTRKFDDPLLNKKKWQGKRIKNNLIYEILYDGGLLIKELIELIVEYIDNEPCIKGNLKYVIGYESEKSKKFTDPLGISTDGINLFICDYYGIIKLSPENENTTIWKKSMDLRDGNRPLFPVIYNSEMYVTESPYIKVYDYTNGKCTRKFTSDNCVGLAIYESNIYVSTLNCGIRIYTLMGEYTRNISLKKMKLDNNNNTNFCTCEISINNNEIWIAGNNVNTILCVSIDGEYKMHLNGIDNGGEQFVNPYSVHATAASIYVGDKIQIQQFTKNGRFIKKFGKGIITDASSMVFLNGKLFVSDYFSGKVLVFE